MSDLFDNVSRNYEGPADYTEPRFVYLNRSAREHYEKARGILNSWFAEYSARYPDAAKDLRKRFRSNDDEHHLAALTELYIHHLLLDNGHDDIHPHPTLPHTSARPEFLVMKDGKPAFIIEVVVVFGSPNANRIEKFENSIFDAMNQIDSRDFLVSIKLESIDPEHPPSIGKIKRHIEQRLSKLDYNEVCRSIEEDGMFPEWTYKEHGWALRFTASPVKEEARHYRTEDSRIVGAIQYPIKAISLVETIKRTVLRKLKKYGDPGIPFIIAANVISEGMFCDNYTIMSALFGHETLQVTTYADGSHTTRPGRTMNGIIVHPKQGIKYTRMSGLMIIPELTGSTLERSKPVLWHHPKPKYPFAPNNLKIAHRIHNPKTDRMEETTI
jgi:hypothetical protein